MKFALQKTRAGKWILSARGYLMDFPTLAAALQWLDDNARAA